MTTFFKNPSISDIIMYALIRDHGTQRLTDPKIILIGDEI